MLLFSIQTCMVEYVPLYLRVTLSDAERSHEHSDILCSAKEVLNQEGWESNKKQHILILEQWTLH